MVGAQYEKLYDTAKRMLTMMGAHYSIDLTNPIAVLNKAIEITEKNIRALKGYPDSDGLMNDLDKQRLRYKAALTRYMNDERRGKFG